MKSKIVSIEEYKNLLNKVKMGNKQGQSMDDFYNDVMDAYVDGRLEQKDFERIMKEVSSHEE
jgi:flagellar motor component MotA